MEPLPPRRPEESRWVLQPLLDAGLGLEEIKALLFMVAFEAVTRGGITDAYLADIVADQPGPVQAAWVQVIGRMIASSDPR